MFKNDCVLGFSICESLSPSDFQSEVGEVFGEIGGELPAKFGRRFSSFFCWGNRRKHFPPKLQRKFHHQSSLRGSGLWRALNLYHNFFTGRGRLRNMLCTVIWGNRRGTSIDSQKQKTCLEIRYHRAKIITKKLFTKLMFRGNSFCDYYKNTLHSARKS